MLLTILLIISSLSTSAACFDTISSNSFKDSESLEALVSNSIIPTMDILIGSSQGIIYNKRFGINSSSSSRFDIASLTKLFTASALMKELESKNISLQTSLQIVFPNSNTNNLKEKISIEDLFRHRSGYKSGVRLSELGDDPSQFSKTIQNLLPSRKYNEFLYSDINYLLLQQILEKYSKKSLEVVIKESLLDPLMMGDTSFEPSGCTNCNPTSRSITGMVHDPTARKLGGIAGNAGIFTTIEDLSKFASLFLNSGEFCGKKILKSETVSKMTKKTLFSNRGLGFDITSAYSVKP